jgi:pSer/pThr/pTyr-binding forkhead associated (FHA) protein
MDFSTWIALGSYGGFAFALLAAGSVSLLALRLRRGSRRQFARASLIALLASAFMLAPIWWLLLRFDVYGPALSEQEVAFWLIWISLFGWIAPLLTTTRFFAFASPDMDQTPPAQRTSDAPAGAAPLDDPARHTYPYGRDHPWGRLTPVDDAGPTIDLSLEVTLIGRDPDDDVILEDDLVSRHHAELRWRSGKIWLLDRDSLNGVRRNTHVARGMVALVDGDIVQFGVRRYRFVTLTLSAASALDETRKVATSSASHPLNATLALVGETGDVAGRRWELREKTTTLGRDPAATIATQDASVSRFHAQITRQSGGYYLADLDSSNGTQVNGERVSEPHRIVAGDLLCFGEVCLRCEESLITIAPSSTPPPEMTATPDATTV